MVAGQLNLRHVGVVVVDLGARRLEQLDQREGRGLADVLDVRLVGDANEQDARAADGP